MSDQPTGNKRKLQHQQTLEHIRSAVDKLVAEKGFAAMTIRDICQEAGIKTGGFYHHFSSKDELLFDRYHRMNQFFQQFYNEQLSHRPAAESLHQMVDQYFFYLKSRVLSVMVQYHATFSANQQDWEAREPNVCTEIVLHIFQKGVQDGQITHAHSPEDMADFLWCLLRGATLSYCTSDGAFLQQSGIEQMIHQWIDSLAQARSGV